MGLPAVSPARLRAATAPRRAADLPKMLGLMAAVVLSRGSADLPVALRDRLLRLRPLRSSSVILAAVLPAPASDDAAGTADQPTDNRRELTRDEQLR